MLFFQGNGVPDILDEVKWELDWELRMQAAYGDGSVAAVVGVVSADPGSPPNLDVAPRW
jgi:hypothetical protein